MPYRLGVGFSGFGLAKSALSLWCFACSKHLTDVAETVGLRPRQQKSAIVLDYSKAVAEKTIWAGDVSSQ